MSSSNSFTCPICGNSLGGGRCPGCGSGCGELHNRGCPAEACPYCGGQLAFCLCQGVLERPTVPDEDRMPWTGEHSGHAECREFGWYTRLVPGWGWRRCDADEFGALPDLDRLRRDAVWDPALKRWVKKTPGAAAGRRGADV